MKTKQNKKLYCPICDSNATLLIEKTSKSFRGSNYEIMEHRFICDSCQFEFTDSRIDKLNVEQVYNLYRVENKVPFPEEIKALREKYELSQNKMSELLGLGINMYRKYEIGEMPSKSNALLIKDLMDSESFEKHTLSFKHLLKDKEIRKIKEISYDNYFRTEKEEEIINEFTGFQKKSLKKASNVLAFFIENFQYSYKTKLNKLFFYVDFLNFKNHGKSITGLTYEAIPYGPVPRNYTLLYGELEKLGYIKIDLESINSDFVEKFESTIKFDSKEFNEDEVQTLKAVLNKFQKTKRDEIVKISHEETAWINHHENRELISYKEHAFRLKAI